MKKIWLSAALACLFVSPVRADPPPATAPTYRPGVPLQPVAIYDQAGNLITSFGGSAPAGSAIAVQRTTASARRACRFRLKMP